MSRLEAEHASAMERCREESRRREEAAATRSAAAVKEARKAEVKMAERFRAAGLASQVGILTSRTWRTHKQKSLPRCLHAHCQVDLVNPCSLATYDRIGSLPASRLPRSVSRPLSCRCRRCDASWTPRTAPYAGWRARWARHGRLLLQCLRATARCIPHPRLCHDTPANGSPCVLHVSVASHALCHY